MRLTFRITAVFLILTLLMVPVTACNGGGEVDTPPAPPPATEEPPKAEPPKEEPPKAEPPKEEPPSKPEPPPAPESIKFDAEILGETVVLEMGLNAALWDPIEVTTADGSVKVNLDWGTTLKDADGKPIREFSASVNENPAQPEDGSRVIGPTVTFTPDSTDISPEMTLEFSYTAFAEQIAAVPDAEIYLAQFAENGTWAKLFTELDEEGKVAVTKIDHLATGHTVGLVAMAPKAEAVDPNAPKNGVNINIEYVSTINAEEPARLIVQTSPNAHVLAFFVLPKTGTRSTRPVDRWRQADDKGLIEWNFTLSRHTARGEGRYEFYVTTSTDPEYQKMVETERLAALYPERAGDITDLKNGKITQLEVDEYTTIKVFPLTVAKGL